MDSYSEVRRVRTAMSKAAGHDIRCLIAKINERRPQAAGRIVDPGTKAEQSNACRTVGDAFSGGESPAAVE
ncbi:MAG: hypothetical protein GXP26_03025 [Planctomycetes bacterium]|nr:hypothetical protein [Planctomycetota bacterium]